VGRRWTPKPEAMWDGPRVMWMNEAAGVGEIYPRRMGQERSSQSGEFDGLTGWRDPL